MMGKKACLSSVPHSNTWSFAVRLAPAVLAVALLLPAPARSGPVMTSVVHMDLAGGCCGVPAGGETIVRDSAGNIRVAYNKVNAPGTNRQWAENQMRTSVDGGATWQDPTGPGSGSWGCWVPQYYSVGQNFYSLAVDALDTMFLGTFGSDGAFASLISQDGSTNLVPLFPAGCPPYGEYYSLRPTVVVGSDGTLHTAALVPSNGAMNIWHAMSTDHGATWSGQAPLTSYSAADDCLYWYNAPNIYAGKDGQLFVLFATYPYGERAEMLLFFDGTTWSAPVQVSAAGLETLMEGDLAVDSTGLLHLAYGQKVPETDRYQLVHRTFDPVSRAFSAASPLLPALGSMSAAAPITLGVYAGDEVVIASRVADTLDATRGGIYVFSSKDGFASPTLISGHPGASKPSLRSSFGMLQPEKIDITWVEPNPLVGGNALLYSELAGGIHETSLGLKLWGSRTVSPGGEGAFLAQYRNYTETAALDAVVTLGVPEGFTGVDTSPGATFIPERNELFWKLGTIAPGTGGQVWAKLSPPWGSSGSFTVDTHLGTKSFPTAMDVDFYLAYEDPVLSVRRLTDPEIDAALAADPKAKALLDWAVRNGYRFNRYVTLAEMRDGTKTLTVFLLQYDPFLVARLISDGTRAEIGKAIGSAKYVLDDRGGIRLDGESGLISSWGDFVVREPAAAGRHAVGAKEVNRKCFANCMTEEVWSKKCKGAPPSKQCKLCREDFYNPGLSEDCQKCIKEYDDVSRYFGGPGKGVTGAGADCMRTLLPSYHECVYDCEDPDNPRRDHPCVEGPPDERFPKYWCDGDRVEVSAYCVDGVWGEPSRYDCRSGYKCNPDTGKCEKQCPKPPGSPPGENPFQPAPSGNAQLFVSSTLRLPSASESDDKCDDKDTPITPARDPNAKLVDPVGDVLPGETLHYTVQYENVGAGTAYGVFILDELSPHLDAASLLFTSGAGEYSGDPARLMSWDVGELGPAAGGEVTYSVDVAPGLPSGTEIVNLAVVHFPSALEVTPTNPVVSVVRDIVAEPKSLTTVTQAPVAATLSGRDSGGGALTCRVTGDPLYGSLNGTAPNLTYTSMEEFSGEDEFSYVVNNGLVDSTPARVRIAVGPDPADVAPPRVVGTRPAADATDVYYSDEALSADDPPVYPPEISVEFSEQIDPATLHEGTFGVNGVSAIVTYDVATRRAFVRPLVALAPSTTYNVWVAPQIADLVGNHPADNYVWHFTTRSTINIAAVLAPEDQGTLRFGDILPGQRSATKVLTLQSTGSEDLHVGVIAKEGEQRSFFRVETDGCSGKTLAPGQSCTLVMTFSAIAKGTKVATLKVASDDPDTPALAVPLQGQVVPFLMDPVWGKRGSVVALSGLHFGKVPGQVLIGTTALKILRWRDRRIRAALTRKMAPGLYGVRVKFLGRTLLRRKIFIVVPPAPAGT